ncbi:MAG: tetratricopeptide repeat protein [Sciscionella sp.]
MSLGSGLHATRGSTLGDRPGLATSYGQLGINAQDQGNYAQAEQLYQAVLTIHEELGNRAGIAVTYHQLGMLDQQRRDYAQAERRYEAALAIHEELGDRAGIAINYEQLGVLREAQGRPAERLPYAINALAIRLGLGSTEISRDLSYLALVQREVIGEELFTDVVGRLLDANEARSVINAVNRFPNED